MRSELDAATRAHFTARAATYTGSGDASLRALLELAAPQPGERALDVATGTGMVLFALAEAVGPDGFAAGVDFTPAMLAQAAARRDTLRRERTSSSSAPPEAAGAANTPGPTGSRVTSARPGVAGSSAAAGAAETARASETAGVASGAGGVAGAGVASAAGPISAEPALLAADAATLPFRDGRFDVVTCRYSAHHMSDPAASLAAMAAVLRPGGRLVIADFVRPDDPGEGDRHDRLERLRGHQYVQIYERARLEQMMAAAGCPVRDAQLVERVTTPNDLLTGLNVAPADRDALAAAIEEIIRHGGGGGFDVRRDGEALKLSRADVVLLGVKRA